MSERDQHRQLAAGAGSSPADPGDHPTPASPVSGHVDVVQAVVALVSDFVEVVDDAGHGDDDEAAPEPIGGARQDLAEGPEAAHGDAVAPGADRGGRAVSPTAR